MLKWAKLDDALFEYDRWRCKENTNWGTFRAKIPGGWLVRFGWSDGSGDSHPMVYVPDPQHRWDGNSLDSDNDEPRKVDGEEGAPGVD